MAASWAGGQNTEAAADENQTGWWLYSIQSEQDQVSADIFLPPTDTTSTTSNKWQLFCRIYASLIWTNINYFFWILMTGIVGLFQSWPSCWEIDESRIDDLHITQQKVSVLLILKVTTWSRTVEFIRFPFCAEARKHFTLELCRGGHS